MLPTHGSELDVRPVRSARGPTAALPAGPVLTGAALRAPIAALDRPANSATAGLARPWFALGLSLAGVMVLAKLALLPFPVTTPLEFLRWLLRLGIVVSPDITFVCGLTLSCWFVGQVLAGWPRLVRRLWLPLCMAAFALCAAYAVASVPMFKVTKVPFTVRVLSFVGGPEVMASSAGQYLPAGMLLALVAGPLAVLLAPWAAGRRPCVALFSRCGRKTAVAVALSVAVGGLACQRYLRAEWTDPNRWERRIAQSPHWVLLASCVEEFSKERPFTHTYSFDEIDDSEFRAAAHAGPASVASPPPAPLLPATERPKNVILIVLESTGVEYFDVGHARTETPRYDTTPHLDAAAARQGVVFDNVYAQAASSCKSLVALTNSVYPRPDWLLIVRDHPQFDIVSLPQVLRNAGYRTCYAHAGYWSWQKRDRFLRARGVDHLVDASDHPGSEVNSWGISDQTMYQDVLDWIDADRDGKPFFAFAYTIETHHPYNAPQEHHDFGVKDEELGRYLESVRGADAKIAWLMAELEKRGLADSTLVAVTADHGESFGQHNLRTHSFGVYEQAVHVPLVLLHRGLREQPRRNATVGRHIDIAPTLLDVLNVPAPAEWQGTSLFRPRDARAYFLSVGNEVVLGLRDGRYKYHYYIDDLRDELFDVEADPREEHNLADDEPARVRDYRSRLGGWVTYQREFLARHGVR